MKKWTVGKVLYWALAAIFSLVFIYPIYFTVISSFKNNNVTNALWDGVSFMQIITFEKSWNVHILWIEWRHG